MLGSAESEKARPISCEIIFQEFQPDHDRPTSITDGRKEGQTTCHGNIPRSV